MRLLYSRFMANSRSARKQIRANQRKHVRNRGIRSAVRTRVNRVRAELLSGVTDVVEDLKAAVREIDRAAEKGVLHPNNARRRKSRIMSLAARLTAGSSAEQAEARRAVTSTKGTGKGKAAAKAPGKTAAAKTAAAKTTAAKSTASKTTAKAPAKSTKTAAKK